MTIRIRNKRRTRRVVERNSPIEPSGRTRSTTIPMVFANRTGLCGVLATDRFRSRPIASANESRVGELTWEEEHLAFFDPNVSKVLAIDHTE